MPWTSDYLRRHTPRLEYRSRWSCNAVSLDNFVRMSRSFYMKHVVNVAVHLYVFDQLNLYKVSIPDTLLDAELILD